MLLRDLTLDLLRQKRWDLFGEPETDEEWWDKVRGDCASLRTASTCPPGAPSGCRCARVALSSEVHCHGWVPHACATPRLSCAVP